jgi:3-deoxy-D-manno-octulosonic-acid transferase
VFIIDTIGLLTKIYSYADIAYIGGGMGTTGLHNTLEAATFGLPIVIGKNYEKFPEAKAMLSKGGLFSICDFETLESTLNMLINAPKKRSEFGQKNKAFVEENKGASELVMTVLKHNF